MTGMLRNFDKLLEKSDVSNVTTYERNILFGRKQQGNEWLLFRSIVGKVGSHEVHFFWRQKVGRGATFETAEKN